MSDGAPRRCLPLSQDFGRGDPHRAPHRRPGGGRDDHDDAKSYAYRFGSSWADALRALAFRPVAAAAIACGVHPYAPFSMLCCGRRGNLVSAIRRKSGLPELAPRSIS